MKKLLFAVMLLGLSLKANAAQICIPVPDPIQARVIDAIAAHGNYKATIGDPANPSEVIPNPETKGQFARRIVIEMIKKIVVRQEAVDSARTAYDTQAQQSNSEITLE